jgi:hypothetical protein
MHERMSMRTCASRIVTLLSHHGRDTVTVVRGCGRKFISQIPVAATTSEQHTTIRGNKCAEHTLRVPILGFPGVCHASLESADYQSTRCPATSYIAYISPPLRYMKHLQAAVGSEDLRATLR